MRQLKDEYQRHIGHKEDNALHTTQQSNIAMTKKYPLANRISGPGGSNLCCNCCKKRNHTTDNCRHLGKPLCANCGRFGHMTEACYCNSNSNGKRKRGDNNKTTQNKYNNNKDDNPQKKGKYNQTNVVDEEVAIAEVKPVKNSPENEKEMYKFYKASDIEDCVSFSENEMTRHLYIECLPDSGTTSHVFNERDLFNDYQPIDNISVGGVGGTKTRVQGKGTIRLIAEHENRRCAITLQNVLHIPECKHNLISLRR
jgi:hypothetical protein